MSLRLPAAERRDQLLDVALEAFARSGFHETSMNDVAELAGVTKPVLYQHFESKRALYLAVIESVGARMMTEIVRATATAGEPRAKVERGTIAFFRWAADDAHSFRFLFDSGTRNDPEFASAVRAVVDRTAESIAPLIAADLDVAHRSTLAHAVVGASEGVARHLIATDAPFDPDTIGTRVAGLLWAGLRSVGS